uniref:Cation/H+ exchanger domain-containing protein n=1 Tax=Cannabis sativa TaxID=3483 RepID=A0A803NU67_CANSA
MATPVGNTIIGIRGAPITCVKEDMNRNYRGIWYGDSPFNFVFPTVLAKVIVITLISRGLFVLLRPLKQPKFVCYVLGGIILGPSFIGGIPIVKATLYQPRETELFRTLAIIGGLYAVFLVGVKMDSSLIARSAKNSWRIGICGFLLALTVTSTLIFTQLDHLPGIIMRGPFVFYVPLSLSYTFFPVVAEALEELNLMNTELGQLAMSSAMLNDFIFWFFLGLSVAFKQDTISHSIRAMFSFIVLAIFTFTVVRGRVKLIIRKTPIGKPINDVYIVCILVGVLFMALASDFIGSTSLLGPLLLGSSLFWGIYPNLLELCCFLSCKIKFKSAILLSLIMNIKGLLELINLHRWIFSTYIDEQTYTQLVLSTLGVTMIVTPLIDILSRSRTRLDLSCRNRGLRTLCSMPKNTEFRILCCVHDEESVHSLITLLEASNPIESSSICTYLVQTSELIGLAAPLLVPYDKKRRKLKLAFSASTDQIIRAFENYAKNSRGPVMILPFIMVASYKTMHESVCRLAQEKFIPLIILPFQLNNRYSGINAHLRQFNANVQAYAPCTVGILVDKGFSCGMSLIHFSYHVIVIFLGGPDDREALAYATRMSDNRMTVTVTVLRIILLRNVEEEESQEATEKSSDEAALDELVVEEFKIKNIGSLSSLWKEITVDDVVEVMNTIRSVEGHYDLVMVGRRRSWSAMMMGDDEMMDFVENEELGLIGDMLASSDFCGGKVSVLVMQHYREGVTTTRSGSNKSLIEKVQLLTRHASR